MSKPSKALIEAIAVTAELTSTQLSATAARVMAADLARYPEHQVLGALVRCRRELTGRLTLAEVLKRLDDGRPGPEEAWAMIPKDEATSVVWSEEMRRAYAIARPLILADDLVAARMSFIEAYRKEVQASRDAGLALRWEPSLGHDPYGREAALLDAVERGRLTHEHAVALLPYRDGVAPAIERLLKAPALTNRDAA